MLFPADGAPARISASMSSRCEPVSGMSGRKPLDGSSCSMTFMITRVDEIVSSIPNALKMISFFGSFTRAMTRGTLHFHFASWQMIRFTGSSPVTAMTASARWQPASIWKRPSSAGAFSTTEPSCSSMNAARRRSLSMTMISWPDSSRAFARWKPTSPPPATTKYIFTAPPPGGARTDASE